MLSLDFETFSEADIKRVGTRHYAEHPTTEALMLAWAIDDQPVQIWDIDGGELIPAELAAHLDNPQVLVSAYNATFERLILENCLGWAVPAERFRCSMVRAYGLSFSGSLDMVAQQFGLNISKDPRGQALIRRFSMPQPSSRKVSRWTRLNDPEGWEEFKQYCMQDVEVERALMKKLECYEYPEIEWGYYALDQKINDRGVPIDRKLVKAAVSIAAQEKKILLAKMRELTGLPNPNSGAQLLTWLKEQGLDLPDMTKETIAKALEGPLSELNREVLLLKQQLAKTSVTKWKAIDSALCEDDRLHGMFQFAGASRTQRWAGRIVQLHNLARGGNTTKDGDTLAEVMLSGGHAAVDTLYGNCMGALSDCIRQAITAPDDYLLNVSDLSSIESRVLGWLSDCKKINETFAKGLDTYKVFATDMYDVPYDQVTKQQRGFCKPPVLGGGYGLGAKGLIGYAEGMGVTMSEEEAKSAIDVFRSRYYEIPELWNWCVEATFYTTRTGNICEGKHGLRTSAHGEFLFLRLPSGRSIAYHQPRVELKEAPWGDMVENFTFMGMDQFTKKWTRISAHGGKIVENIVQAIARDILAIWLDRADRAGFSIVGHVHDEVITVEQGDRLAELSSLTREPISWAPGLLLDADGYVAKRYRKD